MAALVINSDHLRGLVVNPVEPLLLKYSHNIVEHLGLKLYQNKPTNVLAELVSNAWDADAQNVSVGIKPSPTGAPVSIVVWDDGSGMSESTLRDHYLIVGKKKDSDSSAGNSARKPMGRKGIGKLAPFGVARIVDVITVSDGILNWLSFDYQHMLEGPEHAASIAEYAPTRIEANLAVGKDTSIDNRGIEEIAPFLCKVGERQQGTLVLCRNLTLRRPITHLELCESLGRRFTVTLLRDDFKVTVNDELLSEKQAFPEWELRIPESGVSEEEIDTPAGKRTVKHWVGFVKAAAWPSEQAGVGVYAHGKIAQDRPFQFLNRGNEIFARYMYGVIEADWIDELDHDTISTDRTSIDWNDPMTEPLHDWGSKKVKAWIAAYQQQRQKAARNETRKVVEEASKKFELRASEQEHVLDLLQTVTPELPRDHDSKVRLVEATVRAWVHDPSRRLIKKLWSDAAEFDAASFAHTVTKLADELVPESLSLGVAFAQRVFALTQLNGHILQGMETQLQQLIEEFPWILSDDYASHTARHSLKTIVENAVEEGWIDKRHAFPKLAADKTFPDFVFMSTAEDRKILVVELKGPKAGTGGFEELQQLEAYVRYLSSRMPESEVSGLLVCGSHLNEIERHCSPSIKIVHWGKILNQSRRQHMDLLAAMLAGTDASPNDARVQQICELGGPVVLEMLNRMSERDSRLAGLVEKLKPVAGTPVPQLPAPDGT